MPWLLDRTTAHAAFIYNQKSPKMKNSQRKDLIIGLKLFAGAVFFIFSCILLLWYLASELPKKQELAKNPLGLSQDVLTNLVGQDMPYHKYLEWGQPEVLEGSNNNYYLAYLPKANISILYDKKDKRIVANDWGKETIVEKFQQRQQKIISCFSAWDGSHIKLERLIVSSLNDPDSYKHITTQYSDEGDHLMVVTIYTASNLFGGRVKKIVTATSDFDGNVIKILSES